MRFIIPALFIAACALSQSNPPPITITIPVGTPVNIQQDIDNLRASNNATLRSIAPPPVVRVTNHPPNEVLPMSVKMRQAASMSKGKDAPYSQRFLVQRVTADARVREDGQYTTNYLLTLVPSANDTNAPVIWGPNKSKSMHWETEYPAKKGDEFLVFPVVD